MGFQKKKKKKKKKRSLFDLRKTLTEKFLYFMYNFSDSPVFYSRNVIRCNDRVNIAFSESFIQDFCVVYFCLFGACLFRTNLKIQHCLYRFE